MESIYQASFGYADFNTQRTLNENTVFELASVSKQFTALGILICRDRSLLDLVDDIKMFLPDFPYDGITIRHLLTHTSGLPAYEDQFEKFWDHHQIAYNKDVLTMLAAHRDTLFLSQAVNGDTAIPVTPYWPSSLKKYPVCVTMIL